MLGCSLCLQTNDEREKKRKSGVEGPAAQLQIQRVVSLCLRTAELAGVYFN